MSHVHKDRSDQRPDAVGAPSTRARRADRSVHWWGLLRSVMTGLIITAVVVWVRLVPGVSGTTVAAAAGFRGPQAAEASQPLGHPAAPDPLARGSATSYSFEHLEPNSTAPVTFNPCRPIHYVVNLSSAPADALPVIASAFRTASAASGLQFVYQGATSEVASQARQPYQASRYPDEWAPVLITFGDPSVLGQDDAGTTIAGRAGVLSITAPDGDVAYITGEIVLDASYFAAHAQDVTLQRAVLLHEIGHVLGLGHVQDPTQLMNPQLNPTVTSYGAGDLAGLAQLGSGRCDPSV